CSCCTDVLVDASFVFFFSGRRRHTRLVSDWSSAVCSSDLLRLDLARPSRQVEPERRPPSFAEALNRPPPPFELPAPHLVRHSARSEERRVGKEGRTRGSPGD